MKNAQTYFCYLPLSSKSQAWGAYVPDAGFALVPPGSPYPPGEHPADHDFTWERGRSLGSYQFIYITRGSGVFESEASGIRCVKPGDLLIVFPGVWHRYRPGLETGWDEYWIEFEGDYIRRLMKLGDFNPSQPVQSIGMHQTLLQLFVEAVTILHRQPAEFQYLLGALAVQIIARTLSVLKEQNYEGRPVEQIVREAKELLSRQNRRPVSLEQLAAQFNMSYSAFRRMFKTQTGFSPGQFAMEVTVRRAKDILQHTPKPVHLIAEELGFDSIHYFSRLIKQRTGLSPSELRKKIPLEHVPASADGGVG